MSGFDSFEDSFNYMEDLPTKPNKMKKPQNPALRVGGVSKSFCECSFVMIRRDQKTQKAYCFECKKEVQE